MDDICNMKIDHSKLNITANISHEKYLDGWNNMDKTKPIIYWSGKFRRQFNNYDVIYLTHEIFHSIFPVGRIIHSIHNFAIDNELRLRLNKEKNYKTKDRYGKQIDFQGHGVGNQIGFSLENLMRLIYPHWQKYLKDKKENIFEFYERIKEIDEIKRKMKE